MHRFFVFLFASLVSLSAQAAQVRVIDGDTFDVGGERIRIENIDAPEINGARCAAEKALGRKAAERLTQLLSAGDWRLERAPGERRDADRYGRKLRRVITAEGDIGRILIAEGLARPWEGRRKNWC